MERFHIVLVYFILDSDVLSLWNNGNKLKTPSEITPPFKGDKKWAKGRECLGGVLGRYQLAYMMVTIYLFIKEPYCA